MSPSDLPELADALPSVEAAHRRLSAALSEPESAARRAGALGAVAVLLAAAGGGDVGNGVRTWLEVHGASLNVEFSPPERADGAATTLARMIFAGVHRDQCAALARAGLGVGDAEGPRARLAANAADGPRVGLGVGAMDGPRGARAAYAEQVLAARQGAVLAALIHLTAAEARAAKVLTTEALATEARAAKALATEGRAAVAMVGASPLTTGTTTAPAPNGGR